MDLDKITLNECANDGTKIYIYYSAETGMWSSFGYSAFALASLAAKEGVDHIDSFSVQMQMPLLNISQSQVDFIMSKCSLIKEKRDNSIKIHNTESIDKERYRIWTTALRETLSARK